MLRPVLLIDGDDDSHHIVELILEHRGIPYRGARTGTDGIAMARAETPAVVVSELFVPIRSGVCVPELIRNDGALREVPLLVWSAIALEDERRRVECLGAKWLAKPTRAEELLAAILALLPGAPPRPPRRRR
jgi:DNA-binding response OmpR family regulator